MNELILNPELCIDCSKCERNCPKNAIKLNESIPLFCMHCSPDKAPCLNNCPQEAIEYLGGAIIINDEKCIGCGVCRDLCPIGAIQIDGRGQANKCDLCINEETKQCVDACPTNALSEDSQELISIKQKKVVDELKKLKGLM